MQHEKYPECPFNVTRHAIEQYARLRGERVRVDSDRWIELREKLERYATSVLGKRPRATDNGLACYRIRNPENLRLFVSFRIDPNNPDDDRGAVVDVLPGTIRKPTTSP